MDESATGAGLVRDVICSLDGGYNGLEPNQRLGITPQEDGTILYTLTDPDAVVQAFTVTITPRES
jgi:hypothetical protein